MLAVYLGVLAVIILAWPVAVGLHELGHALVATACGHRVVWVRLGTGRPTLTVRIFGVPVTVRGLYPTSGETMHTDIAGTAEGVTAAAGPLVNLALAGLALLLVRLQPIVLSSVAYINFAVAALSLRPRSSTCGEVGRPSDGLRIARWLFPGRDRSAPASSASASSAPASSPTDSIERFTPAAYTRAAQAALALAREEAAGRHAGYIGTEHLLIGLAGTKGNAQMVLRQWTVTDSILRSLLDRFALPAVRVRGEQPDPNNAGP